LNKFTFIFYGDKKNEDLVVSLINSMTSIGLNRNCTAVYYSINYDSDIKLDWIDIKRKDVPITYNDVRDYQLIKPEILLTAMLDYPSEDFYVYLDTDIILSHRFDINEIVDLDFLYQSQIPLCPWHPVNVDSNSKFMLENHYRVFGSDFQLNSLIQNCFIVFSKKQKWFIEEWDALCKSKWYVSKLGITTDYDYFTTGDESIFWGLMIKNRCQFNLQHIHVNHSIEHWIEFSENNQLSWYSSENKQNFHKNTSKLFFYHMMKNPQENNKIINEIINKKWIEMNG